MSKKKTGLAPAATVPLPSILETEGYLTFPHDMSVLTPYILVYGTLRIGGGNYERYKLSTHTQHLGTYCLSKWQLAGIQATYTGNDEDYIVVDMLEICPSRKNKNGSYLNFYEIFYQLDSLEGVHNPYGYTQVIVPIMMEENKKAAKAFAKLYMGSNYANTTRNPNGDYFRPDEIEPSITLYENLIVLEGDDELEMEEE